MYCPDISKQLGRSLFSLRPQKGITMCNYLTSKAEMEWFLEQSKSDLLKLDTFMLKKKKNQPICLLRCKAF